MYSIAANSGGSQKALEEVSSYNTTNVLASAEGECRHLLARYKGILGMYCGRIRATHLRLNGLVLSPILPMNYVYVENVLGRY